MGRSVARGGKKEAVVAARLREARLAVGLSQRELGVQAGMDPSVASPRVNQYERGKHTPDTGTLLRIGMVLNVPVAYFFADDDDLAKVVIAFHRMSAASRQRLLAVASKTAPS
jgi:transcriptional regulator with XRE-family HTH domain